MPYSALRLFWLITLCVRGFFLQLHIPHPLSKVSNTTLKEMQENTGEMCPCKILYFCTFKLFSKRSDIYCGSADRMSINLFHECCLSFQKPWDLFAIFCQIWRKVRNLTTLFKFVQKKPALPQDRRQAELTGYAGA